MLGQGEVDALLSAISGEAADDGDSSNDGKPEVIFRPSRRKRDNIEIFPYDFKRPERVSKDQMRAIQSLHENFARNFGALLSGFLRTIVEVKLSSIEQLTYGDFIQALPNPTCFNLLSCEPLDGQMCLEVSPLIVFPVIDRLLGGGGADDLFIPQRPLTQIEQRLVSKITDRATEAMQDAWSNIMDLKFALAETESNPQLVQIVPPNEVVVVLGFEIKLGGSAGTMSLCIPFNAIEKVMDKLSSQTWSAYTRERANDDIRNRIIGRVNRAPLETTGLLAETTITVQDLLNMQPGDIITTEKQATDPVIFCIEGQKKYLGKIGQFKNKRALQIIRAVGPKDRV